MEKDEILDYVTNTPENTNRAVLGDMLDNYSGGVLPAVTSDDNGDVLTVVEGAWGKAAPSGGGALVVEATTQNGTDFTTDITIGELYEAALTGQVIIYANYTYNNGAQDVDAGFAMPLVDAHHADSGINVVYSFFFGFNGTEVTGEATDTVQFQIS